MSRRMSIPQAKKACEAWNAKWPVGTPVRLARDNGEVQQTKTTTEAYVCEAGYPVIHMENVRGWYLLSRVKAAP